MLRVLKLAAIGLVALIVLVPAGVAGWLALAPPELIRVGAAYSAKIVCSNVFLARRDAQAVLSDDVQAPGHPLLKYMKVEVNSADRTVEAGLFGLFGKRMAVARPSFGCTAVPEGKRVADLAPVPTTIPSAHLPDDREWPEGELVRAVSNTELDHILDDPTMTGPGMRAVIVARAGRIVAERYADGFTPETPLLGWSMTKTVNAAIIGVLYGEKRMSVDAAGLLPGWSGDDRNAIKLGDLLGMASGLAFNEDYGNVTDVTRMLFLEPDMAAFAAAQPLAQPVGSAFSYSSGTAMILSRLWQDAAGGGAAALAYPHDRLFGPLGMESATFEVDAAGTSVGSSYLYATARDWMRFGQLLLQDGRWNGQPLLPADFALWMRQPGEAGGDYGRGQVWLRGPGSTAEADRAAGVPEGAYWLIGHDGQSMAVLPKERLLVLRMGLTPEKLGYKPQPMVAAVARAFSSD